MAGRKKSTKRSKKKNLLVDDDNDSIKNSIDDVNNDNVNMNDPVVDEVLNKFSLDNMNDEEVSLFDGYDDIQKDMVSYNSDDSLVNNTKKSKNNKKKSKTKDDNKNDDNKIEDENIEDDNEFKEEISGAKDVKEIGIALAKKKVKELVEDSNKAKKLEQMVKEKKKPIDDIDSLDLDDDYNILRNKLRKDRDIFGGSGSLFDRGLSFRRRYGLGLDGGSGSDPLLTEISKGVGEGLSELAKKKLLEDGSDNFLKQLEVVNKIKEEERKALMEEKKKESEIFTSAYEKAVEDLSKEISLIEEKNKEIEKWRNMVIESEREKREFFKEYLESLHKRELELITKQKEIELEMIKKNNEVELEKLKVQMEIKEKEYKRFMEQANKKLEEIEEAWKKKYEDDIKRLKKEYEDEVMKEITNKLGGILLSLKPTLDRFSNLLGLSLTGKILTSIINNDKIPDSVKKRYIENMNKIMDGLANSWNLTGNMLMAGNNIPNNNVNVGNNNVNTNNVGNVKVNRGYDVNLLKSKLESKNYKEVNNVKFPYDTVEDKEFYDIIINNIGKLKDYGISINSINLDMLLSYINLPDIRDKVNRYSGSILKFMYANRDEDILNFLKNYYSDLDIVHWSNILLEFRKLIVDQVGLPHELFMKQ